MKAKKKLTRLQAGVLIYIYECIQEDYRPPTIVEITNHFEYKHKTSITRVLDKLVEYGYITKRAGARGLQIACKSSELKAIMKEYEGV